jgi:hypothetical protein
MAAVERTPGRVEAVAPSVVGEMAGHHESGEGDAWRHWQPPVPRSMAQAEGLSEINALGGGQLPLVISPFSPGLTITAGYDALEPSVGEHPWLL